MVGPIVGKAFGEFKGSWVLACWEGDLEDWCGGGDEEFTGSWFVMSDLPEREREREIGALSACCGELIESIGE